MEIMKKSVQVFAGVCALITLGALNGFTQSNKKIVLGFSQIGAESEWRTANTESIKASAAAAGIELKFADADRKSVV